MTSSTQLIATAIRILSIDAVDQAQSGHPGMPLGMADIAAVLWMNFLKFNSKNPYWFNRDRFVLSNGHGSMLQYALLHLFGYDIQLKDIKQFRQLHSKTPGHPERGHTPGVEVTTGPLSQGLANAVGMAIVEKNMGLEFNTSAQAALVDHYTYVFLGDGCLMEGLSHEAASLAGELKLNKLIAFYDCNGISIDGPTSDNILHETKQRFRAYQWQVLEINGHHHSEIETAIQQAQASLQPSLIICHTIIGLGSKLAGTAKVHGSPLDAEDIVHIKQELNWTYPAFEIPADVYQAIDLEKGRLAELHWLETCLHYHETQADLYQEFLRRINGDLPDDWPDFKLNFYHQSLTMKQDAASRISSQACLEYLIPKLPELLGGSADLTPSNNTKTSHSHALDANHAGNYIHYGVREFGMCAIMNGMAAHHGVIPYGGTFLVFADYAKNALRLSAMMELKAIFILTHDSVGLGEDGPTHQPIEQLAMLRYTPNLQVWRPATPLEMAVAWTCALEHQGPSCFALSRQNLSPITQKLSDAEKIAKGGYILLDSPKTPDLIIMATGSELGLAVAVAERLIHEGAAVRVVSMPNPELFLQQNSSYRESVLPHAQRKRIAIEAAQSRYWYEFVGLDGRIIGLNQFGLSAKLKDIQKELHFNVEDILKDCHLLLNQRDEIQAI